MGRKSKHNPNQKALANTRSKAYEAELNKASRMAAIAIMAQPLHLIGDEAGPSEASGLAEEIELDGERGRFDRLKILALDGATQEDLTWLCTEGQYISDRLQAAWWAAMNFISMSHISKSGMSIRSFFDRDVQTLMDTGLFHAPTLMRMMVKYESDSISHRRQYARNKYLQHRQMIALLTKGD